MIRRIWWLVACLIAAPGLSGLAQAQPINVRLAPYNATGNGVTDDTTAFLNAIAALPASGGEIYMPAGRYKLSSTLNVTNKSVSFRGEGQRNTSLIWYNAGGDGIQFVSNTPANAANWTLTVRSLALLRAQGAGGAAISAQWPQITISHADFGAITTTIDDVLLSSEPGPGNSSAYWYWGIRLGNVVCAKISQFNIYGPGYAGGYAGISIGGTFNGDLTSGGPSIGVYMKDGDMQGWVRGLEVKDISEGIHFNNVTVRDSMWAVQLSNSSDGTAITNCQLHARVAGIEITGVAPNTGDYAISGNTIYHEVGQGFTGIHILKGYDFRINGNTIVSTSPTTANGILIEGSTSLSIVYGNTTQGVNVGIWLSSPSVSSVLVEGNVNRGWLSSPLINSGTGCWTFNNVS